MEHKHITLEGVVRDALYSSLSETKYHYTFSLVNVKLTDFSLLSGSNKLGVETTPLGGSAVMVPVGKGEKYGDIFFRADREILTILDPEVMNTRAHISPFIVPLEIEVDTGSVPGYQLKLLIDQYLMDSSEQMRFFAQNATWVAKMDGAAPGLTGYLEDHSPLSGKAISMSICSKEILKGVQLNKTWEFLPSDKNLVDESEICRLYLSLFKVKKGPLFSKKLTIKTLCHFFFSKLTDMKAQECRFASPYVSEMMTVDEIDALEAVSKKTHNRSFSIENTFLKEVEYLDYINDPMKALNDLIGITEAKNQVKRFYNRVQFQKAIQGKGNMTETNNHMVMYGEPGTGKTTVARIMMSLLYDLGIIRKKQGVMVNAENLKAMYVGQTGAKVKAIIDEAIGGVLFIDEAYALGGGAGSNVYGYEAVNVLIQAMQDRKDELVVIFAGYEKDMKEMMQVNQGLNSRIGYWIKFDAFNPTELGKIALNLLKKKGFRFSDQGLKKMIPLLLTAYRNGETSGSGGNARYVERLVQDLVDAKAERYAEGNVSQEELMIIGESEVDLVAESRTGYR